MLNPLKKIYRSVIPMHLRQKIGLKLNREMSIKEFQITGKDKIRRHFLECVKHSSDLVDIYLDMRDVRVMKWHHYLPIYEEVLRPWRNSDFKLLEIGVAGAGSTKMWREYLGSSAVIFGIDIDPRCAERGEEFGEIRIGSQDDPEFLAAVIEEMGPPNVVIDDGSHHMSHIRRSFEFIFPLMPDDGVYIIEDLHGAYWKSCGGGYSANGNFFNYVRELIDDMHANYHSRTENHPAISKNISSINIHDSLCIISKQCKYKPVWSMIPEVAKR